MNILIWTFVLFIIILLIFVKPFDKFVNQILENSDIHEKTPYAKRVKIRSTLYTITGTFTLLVILIIARSYMKYHPFFEFLMQPYLMHLWDPANTVETYEVKSDDLNLDQMDDVWLKSQWKVQRSSEDTVEKLHWDLSKLGFSTTVRELNSTFIPKTCFGFGLSANIIGNLTNVGIKLRDPLPLEQDQQFYKNKKEYMRKVLNYVQDLTVYVPDEIKNSFSFDNNNALQLDRFSDIDTLTLDRYWELIANNDGYEFTNKIIEAVPRTGIIE